MFRAASLCLLAATGILVPDYLPGATATALIVIAFVLLGAGFQLELRLARLSDFAIAGYCVLGAWCDVMFADLTGSPNWLCLPLGSALAGCVAVLIAPPLLKLRRDVFAIVTLGIGVLPQLMLIHDRTIHGVIVPPPFWGSYSDAVPYYAGLAAAVLVVVFAWGMRRSGLGLALRAIRENETACQSVGIDLCSCKQRVMVSAAAISGLAGGLIAAARGSFTPADFDFGMTATVFAIVILGGASQFGAVAAAVALASARLLFPLGLAPQLLLCGAVILLRVLGTAVLKSRARTTEPVPPVATAVGAAAE